jgi:hypothetical protein
MQQPIPAIPYQPYSRDAEHLRLLSIFHYVFGALVMAVSCFAIIHIVLGALALRNPGMFTPSPSATRPAAPAPGPPPALFGYMFLCLGSGALLLGWTAGALTIYAGRCIARRKHWMFVLVMAGVSCMSVPLGTVLGVFTFVVLLRDSVKAQFGRYGSMPPHFAPNPPPNPL